MQLSELNYELPEELIAQYPLQQRTQSRLMVVERPHGTITHSRFYKLPDLLRGGDLLVLNNTRVFPARLIVHKPTGGSVELLFVRPSERAAGAWEVLVRSHRPLREGTRLLLDNGEVLELVGYLRPGRPLVASANARPIEELLAAAGIPALPHYIRRSPTPLDITEYQTVYADKPGAVAAPTAGIHFTSDLLEELAMRGIRHTTLTLHIGPGTFTPVRAPEVERHSMEAEWYTLSAAALSEIELARRIGGRIVAVGTSSARALESYAITGDHEGFTGLFIFPGFRFKLLDAMVTNFHAPRSTVLAMVMALAGRELILNAYREAVRHRYRFLSYGDAMLIL